MSTDAVDPQRRERVLMRVTDHPTFHRFLQCPTFLSSTHSSLDLLVATRSLGGQSEIRFVRLGLNNATSTVSVLSLLRPSWISSGCVGIMPGDVHIDRTGEISLFVQAFFRRGDAFTSSIFSAMLQSSSEGLEAISDPQPVLGGEDVDRFFGVPRILPGSDKDSLVVASPGPGILASAGFPHSYGLFSAPVSSNTVCEEALELLYWPRPRNNWAVAGLATDPSDSGLLWAGIRRTGRPSGSYTLKSFRRGSGYRGRASTEPSSRRGGYPSSCSIHGRPGLLVSLGSFGEGGIGWIPFLDNV